jgi:glycosyltransferase involved in cell wall biosynthesis/2-polyprenyl-3-methyl-5-hydroxy-6-metoxy-1,4-benzoquinol methylase
MTRDPSQKPRRLAVVPSDPLDDYTAKGIGSWLERYFNPARCFDEVYCLSPRETRPRFEYGLHVVPTAEHEFAARLRELRIDVVRAYGGYWACDLACRQRAEGVPVVVSVHDTNPAILHDSVRLADHVLAVSKAVRALLIERGVEPARIHDFANRVDLEVFRPVDDAAARAAFERRFPGRFRVLHVGRKTRQKNVDTLIRALAELGPDYTAILVGHEDDPQYRSLARDLGVLERCHFVDSAPNHELPRYYSFCDCMCTPSRWEGFGIVFIEALACEAVVVTSDVAPMNEYISHERSGLLLRNPEDPAALAAAIHRACSDDALRRRLKRNARAAAQPFSHVEIDRREAALYERFLAGRPTALIASLPTERLVTSATHDALGASVAAPSATDVIATDPSPADPSRARKEAVLSGGVMTPPLPCTRSPEHDRGPVRRRGDAGWAEQRVAAADPWYTSSHFAWAKEPSIRPIYEKRWEFLQACARRCRERTGRSPLRILDAGCGDGYWLARLSELPDVELHGVDYNALRVERAQAAVPQARIVRADLLEFGDGAPFDLILLSQVIEHVPDDVALLRRLRGLLATDGTLVLGTPNEGSPLHQAHAQRSGEAEATDHVHFYTEPQVRERLRAAGFVVHDVLREVFFPGDMQLYYDLLKAPGGFELLDFMTYLVPSQCSDYYFECTPTTAGDGATAADIEPPAPPPAPDVLGRLRRFVERQRELATATQDPAQPENTPRALPATAATAVAAEVATEALSEQQKWDRYYAGAELPQENEALRRFNDEFAELVRELLPAGSRTLEAGCGGGWQSLALSRVGQYDVSLLDFSREALAYARRLFEREGQRADFVLDDVFRAGEPQHDLVFNAGVLEHYTLDEQARFLRGMASRSRNYVLALVPNRLCYWYWLWRMEAQSTGHWPYGKETPLIDMSEAFERAGLTVLGQAFVGASWTEQMIENSAGLTPAFRASTLAVHRSPIIPPAAKCYLLAVLATVRPDAPPPPETWRRTGQREPLREAELFAGLCDSLALRISAESELRASRALLEAAREEAGQWRASAETERRQRAETERAVQALRDWLGHATRDVEQRALAIESRTFPQVAELAERLREMSSELHRREQAIERLEATRRELHDWSETLTRQLREKGQEADRIWRRLEAAEDELRTAQGEMERLRPSEARLSEILNSTGWRVLRVLYRIRFFLFPRGSLREKAARKLMQWQRRLRRGAPAPPVVQSSALRDTGVQSSALHPSRSAGQAPALQAPALRDEQTGGLHYGEGGLHYGEVAGLVSVILPVYNQADLLAESIDSVLAQTYGHFELIVVNDGSTDGVRAVLDRYAGHPKVRLLTQANQKLPKALSNGFEFARGEFWTWTSADNVMEPVQLERQVAFLRANPDAHMVYADYLAIDDRGQPLRDPDFRPHNRRSPDDPRIHLPRSTDALSTRDDNFIGACFMYRGWVGRLLGDYAPNLGVEDYDYWMRMDAQFVIRHLGTDECLYRYRVHDNTLNARAREHKIAERVRRLMTCEQERAAFNARPWTLYVDEPTRAWLAAALAEASLPQVSACRSIPDGGWPEPGADEKPLVLVRADALTSLPPADPPASCCVAAWLDEDEAAAYHHGAAIQQRADVAFAPSQRAAQRLALYARRVFRAPPGRELLEMLIRFANNDLFFRATTPEGERRRVLPRVHRPGDRRLRVLLQVEHFLQGGFEQVVLDIATVLDPQRYELAILALGRQGIAAERARRMGLDFTVLPQDDREAAYRRYLAERRFDLVNAHYAPWGAEIARELGIPFVQTVHSSYVWLDDQQKAAQRAAEPHTLAYLCVSTAAAGYADLRLGLPADKMVIVPNGIDAGALDAARACVDRAAERKRLGFPPDSFVFLHTASLYAPKGQHLLIAALAQAVRSEPRLHVALLGKPMDEKYAERLREQAQRLGVADRVHFLGYHDDPQRFYCICDGFVLPSFVEGWSLALAEALYARLPVIASNVGSAGDLLTRTGGVLLDPPFDSIIDLDAGILYELLDQEHPAFIAALADALVKTAGRPQPPRLTPQLAASLDRRTAYQAYGLLYDWLASGGAPSAARPWVWELHGAAFLAGG